MIEKEKLILISQKIEKAKTFLNEINNHIAFGYYETSVNRIYYACFYCVQALLVNIDLYPKSHKGVLVGFNLHYVKEGKFSLELARFYQEVFEHRLLADYSDAFDIRKEDVLFLFDKARIFFDNTELLLKKP